jgi:6-phosphogluconolactonase
VLAPDGRHALVADFGADRVFVYGFDRATHSLSEAPVSAFAAPPGSGPHHLVFGAGGRFAYLLNELSADVIALRWNAEAARLDAVQTVPLSSPGFAGVKSGSELALSADGRFLYAANRAQSQVLVYGVDAATGELRLLQRQASGGEAPWTFALHSSGNWMLVAHARGNRVDLLGVDPATGRLSATDQVLQMAAPLSLAFVD